MLIGVLALQGAFIEHEKMLETLGVDYFEIRKKEDLLQKFDGLIIPGGESTVIGKLLKELSLFDDIKKSESGKSCPKRIECSEWPKAGLSPLHP